MGITTADRMLFLVVQTLLAALCVAALLIALVFRSRRQRNSIGFFHPYSDDGGGGERVLWCAIAALHKSAPNTRVVVFTAPPRDGNHDPEKIKQRAKDRFNVEITGDVTFIWLFHRQWVEASSWPRATMVGQSLGSLLLGFEALSQFNPECFIDTMGYAFTLPMARWMCGCSIAAYVHYPTISSDMEDMVASGSASHNNTSAVARSRLRTTIKLCYYRVFKALYSLAGMHAEKVMDHGTYQQLVGWKACPAVSSLQRRQIQGASTAVREEIKHCDLDRTVPPREESRSSSQSLCPFPKAET